MDRVSKTGRKDAVSFPRAHIEGCPYDFSFSGLKSAVLNYLNSCRMKQGLDGNEIYSRKTDNPEFDGNELIDPETGVTVADVAASFQEAVVDALISKTIAAAKDLGYKKIAIAGGVASNSALREGMRSACEKEGFELYYPKPLLCTDNAVMIGCAAYYEYISGTRHGYDLNAVPNLKLGER